MDRVGGVHEGMVVIVLSTTGPVLVPIKFLDSNDCRRVIVPLVTKLVLLCSIIAEARTPSKNSSVYN